MVSEILKYHLADDLAEIKTKLWQNKHMQGQ